MFADFRRPRLGAPLCRQQYGRSGAAWGQVRRPDGFPAVCGKRQIAALRVRSHLPSEPKPQANIDRRKRYLPLFLRSRAWSGRGGESVGEDVVTQTNLMTMPAHERPLTIDEVHLERMTLGDRSLEREVLEIFARQTTMTLARIAGAGAGAGRRCCPYAQGLRARRRGMARGAGSRTARGSRRRRGRPSRHDCGDRRTRSRKLRGARGDRAAFGRCRRTAGREHPQQPIARSLKSFAPRRTRA